MQKKHRKKCYIWLITIITMFFTLYLGAGYYFYQVAFVPGHKSFLKKHKALSKSDPLYKEKLWYLNSKKQQYSIKSADNKFRLVANYLPASSKSFKTVVILHGYMGNKDKMGQYAALFHQLGYNVLLPDARSHGASQGHFIGYGWPERNDVKKWSQYIIKKQGSNSKIVIFGLSMGAATAMMTSGEKLPTQVKAIIEDCGYTSIEDELNYEANKLYKLPSMVEVPIVKLLSLSVKIKYGYFLSEGSCIKQLEKNHRPFLFIHGEKDKFVPMYMVYKNYRACRGPKELWVTKKAAHAESFPKHPKIYKNKIAQFLNKYV